MATEQAKTTQEPGDSNEVREWREAISSVIAFEGVDKADEVLTAAVDTARRYGARLPFSANTAYINTIAPHEEPPLEGNRKIEAAIKSAIRWNALAMVLRANKTSTDGLYQPCRGSSVSYKRPSARTMRWCFADAT